jgi:hypothetical protein
MLPFTAARHRRSFPRSQPKAGPLPMPGCLWRCWKNLWAFRRGSGTRMITAVPFVWLVSSPAAIRTGKGYLVTVAWMTVEARCVERRQQPIAKVVRWEEGHTLSDVGVDRQAELSLQGLLMHRSAKRFGSRSPNLRVAIRVACGGQGSHDSRAACLYATEPFCRIPPVKMFTSGL